MLGGEFAFTESNLETENQNCLPSLAARQAPRVVDPDGLPLRPSQGAAMENEQAEEVKCTKKAKKRDAHERRGG